MKQLLIYDNLTPLTRQDHGNLSLRKLESFAFARQTNAVPLVVAEFPLAAIEYAIVFTDTEEGIVPAAILGARNGENLFVDDNGRWNAAYAPAFVRRYPFAFATDEKAERFTVMIDPGHSGFNTSGEGDRLFNADGTSAPLLETMIAFLQEYQGMFARTKIFGARLAELGVLDAVEANMPLPSDPQRKLAGFKIVNRDKLKSIPADVLAQMLREDELEFVFLHLFSLRNLDRLKDRLIPRA
jgi:hypothetical protein